MRQQSHQSKILKKKPMNKQIHRNVKFNQAHHEYSPSEFHPSKTKIQNDSQLKNQTISPLLNPNISLIEGSSFISNRQDGSFDSMDKMIIGVPGLDNKQQEQDQINTSNPQIIDFTHLHEQYEQVIGKKQMLENEIQEVSRSNQTFSEEEALSQEQQEEEEDEFFSLNQIRNSKFNESDENKKSINYRLNKLQLKIQECKPQRKTQDLSYNSIKFLANNLSQIHEEWENHHNNSGQTKSKGNQDQQEKELIDFVSKPDPLENKNEQKNNERNEDDEIVTLLQKQLEEKSLKNKNIKENKKQKTGNYQHILEGLSREQQNEYASIFLKREEWIRDSNRPESWKRKQIRFLQKMNKILKNPFYEDNLDSYSDGY